MLGVTRPLMRVHSVHSLQVFTSASLASMFTRGGAHYCEPTVPFAAPPGVRRPRAHREVRLCSPRRSRRRAAPGLGGMRAVDCSEGNRANAGRPPRRRLARQAHAPLLRGAPGRLSGAGPVARTAASQQLLRAGALPRAQPCIANRCVYAAAVDARAHPVLLPCQTYLRFCEQLSTSRRLCEHPAEAHLTFPHCRQTGACATGCAQLRDGARQGAAGPALRGGRRFPSSVRLCRLRAR